MKTVARAARGTTGPKVLAESAGRRIESRRVEIGEAVKNAAVTDKFVDTLPPCIDLNGAVCRGAVQARRNGCADHSYAAGMQARDALAKSGHNSFRHCA